MSDFQWPEGRLLTLQELKAAYESGALHSTWEVEVDNFTVCLYVPKDLQERAMPNPNPDSEQCWPYLPRNRDDYVQVLYEDAEDLLKYLLGDYLSC